MSKPDAAPPRSTETAPQRPAPFARKLGFTADHQRLLDAVVRGKQQIQRPT